MTTQAKTPILGKDIVLSDAAPPATLQQVLQGLLDEMGDGCTMHDQVRTLIEVCIAEGVTTGADIIAAIVKLGFDRSHVGMWLSQECGPNPKRHSWYKDADGLYCPHG